MQNEIIETYLTASEIKGNEAAKIREVACKVAEFYRTGEHEKKTGLSTAQAKRELIPLLLPNETRRQIAIRLDKYAAMVSGAKCDGSIMTAAQPRENLSTPILRVRI